MSYTLHLIWNIVMIYINCVGFVISFMKMRSKDTSYTELSGWFMNMVLCFVFIILWLAAIITLRWRV